jgi:predicted Zn-dependent peptidase
LRRCIKTQDIDRARLCEGVFFTGIRDPKFKFNHISVSFAVPLSSKTAAVNALLPQVLLRGCREYPDMTAMNRRLKELYGARLETGVTKIGESQIVTFYCEVLGDEYALGSEKLVCSASGLLKSVIFDPALKNGRFGEDDIRIERRNLADLIQSRLNDKRYYASQRLRENMCGGEPYGICELGTVEQAQSVTSDELYAAWLALMAGARIEIFFVGPGDSSDCRELFASAFRSLVRRPVPYILPKPIKDVKSVRSVTERMPVAQAKLGLGFRTDTAHPDTRVAAMQLACTVLGGSANSLLFKNVREKLSLCYYCFSRFEPFKGIVTIESGVEEDNAVKAKDEILRQLDDVREGNFTDDDLGNALRTLDNVYRGVSDSLFAISDFYLGRALRSESGDAALETPAQAAEKYARLTRDDVIAAARGLRLDTVYLLAGEKEGAEK